MKMKRMLWVVLGISGLVLLLFVFYQHRIYLTPIEVKNALINSGYDIKNIDHNPYISSSNIIAPVEAMMFDVCKGKNEFSIRIVAFKSWITALKVTYHENQINKSVQGNYIHSINFGKLVIQIYPPDKNFGKDISRILKEYYFSEQIH